MKNFKKIASIVLALVMVFALTSVAFAANDGTITVENPVKGQTYTIYKIFNLVTYDEALGAYRYSIPDEWKNFVNGEGAAYVEYDETIGSVKWKHAAATLNHDDYDSDEAYEKALELANDAIYAEFAKKALEYAKNPANGVSSSGTKVAGDDAVQFTNLALGYYLVDSSLGALCALTTTHKDATVKEKNYEPTLEKEVKKDSTDAWGDRNDANIGDTVNFKITVSAQKGAENYVVHDKMSTGLSYNTGSVVVEGLTKDVDYTVTETGLTDGCTFEVVFTKTYLDSLTANTDIVITYSAILNENANIGDEKGNDNDAKLTYGDSSETEWDKTKTFTWSFDIEKYTVKDEVNTRLEGAEFELYAGETATGTPIKFSYDDTTKVYTVDPNGATTTITAGLVNIKGLDSGKYTLVETKAPDGYNKVTDPTVIEISVNREAENGKITLVSISNTNAKSLVTDEATTSGHVVSILNQTGTELPSTGGIGTTIFYVVGGLLLAAAVILLVTRRRMATAK